MALFCSLDGDRISWERTLASNSCSRSAEGFPYGRGPSWVPCSKPVDAVHLCVISSVILPRRELSGVHIVWSLTPSSLSSMMHPHAIRHACNLQGDVSATSADFASLIYDKSVRHSTSSSRCNRAVTDTVQRCRHHRPLA